MNLQIAERPIGDLTAPPVMPNLFPAGDKPAAKDQTNAERQRRYRQKHRNAESNADSNGESNDESQMLVRDQPEIRIGWNAEGDCLLIQKNWPDDDSIIRVAQDHQQQFLDGLCDAFGVPSVGN